MRCGGNKHIAAKLRTVKELLACRLMNCYNMRNMAGRFARDGCFGYEIDTAIA